MAKPARVKKKQAAPPPAKKGEKKAVAKKSADKAAAKGKAKGAKAAEAKGGLRGRMAKAQAAKAAKPAKGAAKEKRSAIRFLREVRVELSKVTWPTREELIQSTVVVLIAVAIAGLYIAFFDAIFSRLISLLG